MVFEFNGSGRGEKAAVALATTWQESLFGLYSHIARSERGSYRLCRKVRSLRPVERWRDCFKTPHGLELDLNLGVYPDVCMAYGLYELSTIRLLRRLIKPGDHVVDAGANIGYLTLHMARMVGPLGRVDAFEPEPGNLARLQAHLARNGMQDRVKVYACALSDHQGKAPMYRWPEDDLKHNHGCASLYSDYSDTAQTLTVECCKLDDHFDGDIPKLIKMDIEGAEPMMVEGMLHTLLSPNPPIIIGELNPSQARIAGFAPHEWICRILDIQPQYRIYTIGSRLRHRKLNDLAGLGQINLLLKY